MGKGSSTKEQNVKKQLDFTTSGGAGGRLRKQDNHSDKCLFSFKFEMLLDSGKSKGISPSADVVLVLAPDGNGIDIFIAGSDVGAYTGSRVDLIASCMKQGYIYEGVVTEVKHGPSKTTVSCDITGHTK